MTHGSALQTTFVCISTICMRTTAVHGAEMSSGRADWLRRAGGVTLRSQIIYLQYAHSSPQHACGDSSSESGGPAHLGTHVRLPERSRAPQVAAARAQGLARARACVRPRARPLRGECVTPRPYPLQRPSVAAPMMCHPRRRDALFKGFGAVRALTSKRIRTCWRKGQDKTLESASWLSSSPRCFDSFCGLCRRCRGILMSS